MSNKSPDRPHWPVPFTLQCKEAIVGMYPADLWWGDFTYPLGVKFGNGSVCLPEMEVFPPNNQPFTYSRGYPGFKPPTYYQERISSDFKSKTSTNKVMHQSNLFKTCENKTCIEVQRIFKHNLATTTGTTSIDKWFLHICVVQLFSPKFALLQYMFQPERTLPTPTKQSRLELSDWLQRSKLFQPGSSLAI